MILGAGGLAASAPAALALADWGWIASPAYQGPPTDHFDGKYFHNLRPLVGRGWRQMWRWRRQSRPGPWRPWTAASPGPAPPRRVDGARLRVTYVNHATTLIQTQGINILTDPTWSERCSPVGWAGPRRVRPPGLRYGDLPRIDLILLSHNHYDHLDLPTLARLERDHRPRLLCPLGNAQLLKRAGIRRGEDMDWWETRTVGPVRLWCVPAQHWSGRGLSDRGRTLWGGFVLTAPGGPVYFAGDTGDGPHFERIVDRVGAPRLALLPIGAYLPDWFMGPVHLSPLEAVRVHRRLRARVSLGIHFGTFRLADDGQDQPLEDLAAARRAEAVGEEDFWVLDFGQGREVPPTA